MKTFTIIVSLACLAVATVTQLIGHYDQVPFYMGLAIMNYLAYSNDKE